MPDNGEFYVLIPLGVQPSSHETSSLTKNQSYCVRKKIKLIQESFLELCIYSADRPLNNNKKLVNKAAFILKLDEEKVLDDEQLSVYRDKTLAYLEALVCDKGILFSNGFSAYNVNHKMLRQIRENTGTDDKTQELHCIKCALEYAKDEDKDNFRLALEAIISHAKKANHSVEFYYNELRGSNRRTGYVEKPAQPSEDPDRFLKEPDRLLEKLRKWVPDLPLKKDNVAFFVMYCLNKYCTTLYKLKQIKKNAGHFKVEYTKAHKKAVDNYETNLRIITSYREILKSLEDEVQLSGKELLASLYDDTAYDKSYIEQIRQHTIEYLKNISGSTKESNVPIDDLTVILRQLKKTSLFPFKFLMLCASSGKKLFESGIIDSDVESDFESHEYMPEPEICIQRLSRLSFLCKLCDAFCCKRKDVEKNLLYFIKYHGLRIDSPEEADQWEAVLNKYNLMDSPVSLGLRYYRLATECIPFRSKRLLCYKNCSALHLGGLYSFMHRFPNYDDTYYLTSEIESSLKKDYLEQWSSESLKPDKVKELCSKVCNRLEWKDPKEIHKWMNEWEREDVSDVHLTRRPIDEDELKCLLIEARIQKEWNRKAWSKLYELLMEVLGEKLEIPNK